MASAERAAQARAKQLAVLTGWTGDSPPRLDWPAFDSAFGHVFPADFRSYVELFPPGAFGMVNVFHPLEPWFEGDPRVYVEQLLARNDQVNDVEDRFRFRFGDQPGELIAWGTVNGEFELCWEITADPSDTWNCVVADVRGEDSESYHGGMLALLLDVVGGTGRIRSLDYLRGDPLMTFGRYGEPCSS
ncbi:hypothetical protein QTQ03_26285 [Micromonospora sp. WMMA1363]|uniref:hypothetical protein n=1 Tax=Micromonospora sp. WMMA1363 TaxID=3053985 RepID=UPI00259CCB55|nr:hypothetical protein [Micromonospora sp. WMMA1363]MDM4722939.1 hypothetical protein [Micromonospora sp. WMMA1363]